MNLQDIQKTWLNDQAPSVRAAALDVLDRTSGCADPDCGACRENRRVIETLIKTVKGQRV
jgi:hypothetical protein